MHRKITRPILALTASVALASGMGLTFATASAAAPDASPSGNPAGTTSSATSTSDVDDMPAGAVAAMKRDLGLRSDAQVSDRLDLDAQAADVEKKLDAKFGTHYAGTWVNAAGTGITVGVTTDAQAKAARALGATPHRVDSTTRQLDRIKKRLDAHHGKASTSVNSWYVDATSNEVVVTATTASAARSFVKAAGVGDDDVSIQVAAPIVPQSDLRGGDEYRHITSQSGGVISYSMCSIGFPVTQGGFVSAGHCGQAGDDVVDTSWNALGTFQASGWPAHDWSWVKTTSAWTPTGKVYNWNGDNWIPVFGSDEAPIGASICHSGRTTHWQCGTITAKDLTVNYESTPTTGLTETSACSGGGDSGGAFISGNQAQGVLSGGSGDCSGAHTSVFQPVNPILSEYDLTLALGTSIQGYNDKCIDVPSSDFVDSKPLQIYTCNGTDAQAFRFRANGTIEVGGKCMDLRQSDTSDGNVVQIYHCNGTMAQQFTLNSAGDLVSELADKCVDVKDWNGDNGGQLQIWTCTGAANQKWHKH